MLRSTSLRVLRPEDLAAVTEVLSVDPVADVFVAPRVQAVGLDPARLGGEMWGYAVDGRLTALCHAGANLVPVQADDEAVAAFADRARRLGRRCASIVGERAAVAALWHELEPSWGPAREADLGVASGNGKGQIFVRGEVIKTVPESQIVETLIEEAMRIAEEMEREGVASGEPAVSVS